jgi:hypothetical protein
VHCWWNSSLWDTTAYVASSYPIDTNRIPTISQYSSATQHNKKATACTRYGNSMCLSCHKKPHNSTLHSNLMGPCIVCCEGCKLLLSSVGPDVSSPRPGLQVGARLCRSCCRQSIVRASSAARDEVPPRAPHRLLVCPPSCTILDDAHTSPGSSIGSVSGAIIGTRVMVPVDSQMRLLSGLHCLRLLQW